MKVTANGLTITYPDLGFAFNPIRVLVEGLSQGGYIAIEANGIKIEREAISTAKSISFDLSAIAKSLFDRLEFHKIEMQDKTLYKELEFRVYDAESIKHEQPIGGGKIPILWGALQIGEKYTQNKVLTYFRGYPFTFPLYIEKEILLEAVNEQNDIFPFGFLGKGKYNLTLNEIEADKHIKIKSVSSSEYRIFDYTFDYTFGPQRVNAQNVIELDLNIKIADCVPDGIYLRWINKYGEYNYYLFQSSNETSVVKNRDVEFNNVYHTTDLTSGYHQGIGKNIGKSIEQTKKLFAHLVDIEAASFLQHLVESPIVDMFLGYGENNTEMWVSVNIQEGTFVKSTASLQDFEFILIPQNKLVQTL